MFYCDISVIYGKGFLVSFVFLEFQALDLIRGKNILLLMDSSLEGQYANEDALKLVDLASKCLQFEARDRPNIKYLLSSVGPLQKQKEVSSLNNLFPSILPLYCFYIIRC